MKRAEGIAAVFLMLSVAIFGVVMMNMSIFASTSGTQSTQNSVHFDGDSGIRYNTLSGEFEVFSATGLSYIASGKYISVTGDVAQSIDGLLDQDNWLQASSVFERTYNVMNDIVFTSDYAVISVLPLNTILNGRGYYLKNFAVSTMEVASEGTIGAALVMTNNGIIRNLNFTNTIFDTKALSGTAAGLLCGVNNGIIENVTVYGSETNNVYESAKFDRVLGVAAINYGTISKSRNYANLTSVKSGGCAAGIAEAKHGSQFLDNLNAGEIRAVDGGAYAAGIALMNANMTFTVRSNINNGRIVATVAAAGIVSGAISITQTPIVAARISNANNGTIISTSGTIYELYIGYEPIDSNPGELPVEPLSYGIKWNSAEQLFEVSDAVGVTYIGSNYYVDSLGLVDKSSPPNNGLTSSTRADGNAHYKIMNNITYILPDASVGVGEPDPANYNPSYSSVLYSLQSEGVLDGGGHTLSSFPLREWGNRISALFATNEGKIQNLTLDGISYTNTNLVGAYNVGAIAAESSGKIDSVNVSGSITARSATDGVETWVNLGGLVGAASGSITDSSAQVNLTGGARVGGIVGVLNFGTISECVSGSEADTSLRVSANVRPSHIGGIVGFIIGSASVSSCNNYLSFGGVRGGVGESFSYAGAGGIVGGWNPDGATELKLSNCANLVDLNYLGRDWFDFGGVLGTVWGSAGSTLRLVGCYNSGYVDHGGGYARGGGIVGRSLANFNYLDDCLNEGAVRSRHTVVAGIIGAVYGAAGAIDYESFSKFTSCTNNGDIRGLTGVGGILGDGGVFEMDDCENNGDVIRMQNLQGRMGVFAGRASDGSSVSNCRNYGRWMTDSGNIIKTGEDVILVGGSAVVTYTNNISVYPKPEPDLP